MRANDIVIFHGVRWRVVLVTTGSAELGTPERLRLMRIVECNASEVKWTGENISTVRARALT